MIDNIPVYHAHDVLEGMDPDIIDVFWQTLKVSYGDASFTLIPGGVAYSCLQKASEEVAERRGVAMAFSTPHDLADDGIYFAITG